MFPIIIFFFLVNFFFTPLPSYPPPPPPLSISETMLRVHMPILLHFITFSLHVPANGITRETARLSEAERMPGY